MMDIIHFSPPAGRSPLGFAADKLIDLPAAVVMRLALTPGQKVEPHAAPVDVLFYVEKGTGRLSVGGEEDAVAAGDLIFSPAKTKHGLEAGPEGICVLIFRVPRP